MKRAKAILLAAFAMPALASPVLAQTMSASEQAAVQRALNRGQLLYEFDQAAWHATDAMTADAKNQGLWDAFATRIGGWIVRIKSTAELEVLFFDKTPNIPKLLYIVGMSRDGKKVISSKFADDIAPDLDALTLKMIRSQKIAAAAITGKNLLRCAAGAYNFTVLPPDTTDGSIPTYILSPQSDLTHVPFGGHARIVVQGDGTAGPIHEFTKGCMELPNSAAPDAPKALVATQLMDPIPTEIGVFTMLAAGLPLYIGTRDGRIWALEAPEGVPTIRIVQQNPKKQ